MIFLGLSACKDTPQKPSVESPQKEMKAPHPIKEIPQALKTSVCGRSKYVKEALMKHIVIRQAGITSCADVMASHLKQIETLFVLDLSSLHYGSESNLNSNDFSGLSNLKILNLSNNRIRILPEGVFNTLTALVELDLSDNIISDLSEKIFSELSSLQILKLNNNPIGNLLEEVFNSLTSLIELDLGNISISNLHLETFSSLTSLQVLRLNNPPLQGFPFEQFSSSSPDETKEAVFSIFESLFEQFSSISPGERTEELSPIFKFLADQKRNNNKISTLPEGVFNALTALVELDLSNISLKDLSVETFSPLTSLQILRLNNNHIKVLPIEFLNSLTSLKRIELTDNNIEVLPANICNELSSLQMLWMPENNLSPEEKQRVKEECADKNMQVTLDFT